MTAEELRQWLLNNRVSDSSTSKCPRDNVCSEIPFRVSSYHMKFSQLITIWDKLAGFSIVRFLLRCTYDCGVCSGMLFGRDLCNAESGNLIYNANELTGSYIVPAFIERYFRKDIVVCLWVRKPVNWLAILIVLVFAERHFCTDYDWRQFLLWIFFL